MLLSRRQLLVSTLACGAARAQTKYPGINYREYSRCLPDYLRRLARQAYEKRNAELLKLTSREAVAARQRWARSTFWQIIGGEPERTPLASRVTGSFTRPGYRLEKIVYESRPGVFVTANLYVPSSGSLPYPGILFQMGHSLDGKANDGYQKCCQGLARLGFVVLAFDPMGQGERTYYPGVDGVTRLGSADDEHTYPGKQMLLVGDTASRFQVWDAVRSLDYLASRPEVDPKRLASTGQSGGATLTMMLACVDDRLAAAAVCSGNTENVACANFDPPGATDDAEQDFIGSGELGFDRWDLFYPFAPKPLLVLVSAKDFFGTYSPTYISNGWEEFQKLQHAYAILGRRDAVEWVDSPLPHGLAYHSRMKVYNFMRRRLQTGNASVLDEPDVRPEPERELWAGATGNVVRDFGSKTPFILVRERARNIVTPERPRDLERLLRLERPPAPAKARVLGSVPSGSLTVQAIEVFSAPEVAVPAWLFMPKKREGRTILLLDERGRNIHWREGGLCEQIASRGRLVCAADLRGIGDLRPETGRGSAGYTIGHENEENYAWASLILGRPLLGQRVADTLALTEALSEYGPVALAANGRLTVPALFAAALDHRIESVYLAGGFNSYRSIAETENYKAPPANFLFDVLHYADLPQLAALVPMVKIALDWTVDALTG
jgi:dienelactone hydrolase